jgi:putative oxidoreductase
VDWVILAGRILFFFLFAFSALGHITQREMMSQYAGQKGVPFPSLLVPLTGVQILVGSLMVLLGIWADLGAAILVVFLIPTALAMHAFWKLDDPMERQQDQVHFLKDIALAGAGLMLFGLFQQFGAGIDLMITDPLF